MFLYVDAYRTDPFFWKHSGSIDYPRNNPEFVKIYYSCINGERKTDGRCVKHVYISKTNEFDVLVQYSGMRFDLLLGAGRLEKIRLSLLLFVSFD